MCVCVFVLFTMRAASPAHLILLDIVTRMKYELNVVVVKKKRAGKTGVWLL